MKLHTLYPLTHAYSDLRSRVDAKLHVEFRDALPTALITHLLREAESSAVETGVPHLVLPLIAEEKLRFYAARHSSVAA